jgi:5-methylcytosine-specific restriction protein A
MNWNDPTIKHNFYISPEWKAIRAYHLSNEPLCRKCLKKGIITPATIVDHIQEVEFKPELRLEDSNLQSVCLSCHTSKTNKSVAESELTLYKRKWDF